MVDVVQIGFSIGLWLNTVLALGLLACVCVPYLSGAVYRWIKKTEREGGLK